MIQIKITSEMIEKARDFAEKKQPTSYPRFGETKEEQIERLTVGKLGELAGQVALQRLEIPHACPDKLKVVEEMSYGDISDCIIRPNTANEKKVDFKTAWKPFHKRILVPKDMFLSQVKDSYIGVKINLEQLKAEVYGYISRRDLATRHPIQDFHIGDAYWAYLSELEPLEKLKQ